MTEVLQRSHERRRRAAMADTPGLLCVSNYPANTGYAWDFIESLYAGLGDRLQGRGIRTYVAYPRVEEAPKSLAGSHATAIELDVALDRKASLDATLAFIRANNIQVVYLCDRAVWDPRYAALRKAGVRRIIVHDHTSGERTEPRGLKRILKRARMALPGSVADEVIAVSEFVAHRKRAVDLVPAKRVTRVWNSIRAPQMVADARVRLLKASGLSDDRLIVACASRASREKGLPTLLAAFDLMVERGAVNGRRPALLHMGDGPELDALRAMREGLRARDDIILAGYVKNAVELLGGADLCVVPSVWQEAFGLAALEPMACGVAVVASRVGGIPEVVVDGETGRLVEPGDETALADAMHALLKDAGERARLGANGRSRALEVFSRERQLEELDAIVTAGFYPQGTM